MLILTEIYYPSLPDFACSWITGCFRKYKVLSDSGFLAVSLAPVVCFLTYRFVQPLVSSILPMQQQGFWQGERTTASPGDKHIPLACGVWKLTLPLSQPFSKGPQQKTLWAGERTGPEQPWVIVDFVWVVLKTRSLSITETQTWAWWNICCSISVTPKSCVSPSRGGRQRLPLQPTEHLQMQGKGKHLNIVVFPPSLCMGFRKISAGSFAVLP